MADQKLWTLRQGAEEKSAYVGKAIRLIPQGVALWIRLDRKGLTKRGAPKRK